MTPETRKLLAALSAMNQEIPNVAMRLIDDSLSRDKQIEFGNLLIELGAAVHENAHRGPVEIDYESMLTQRELQHRYSS